MELELELDRNWVHLLLQLSLSLSFLFDWLFIIDPNKKISCDTCLFHIHCPQYSGSLHSFFLSALPLFVSIDINYSLSSWPQGNHLLSLTQALQLQQQLRTSIMLRSCFGGGSRDLGLEARPSQFQFSRYSLNLHSFVVCTYASRYWDEIGKMKDCSAEYFNVVSTCGFLLRVLWEFSESFFFFFFWEFLSLMYRI